MPPKKNTKIKKKAPVRAKRVLARKTTVPRTMVDIGKGFPKKMQMTHKYTENVILTSASGVLATYKFSCNNMYDPNFSGTGHQPLYFDQMAALYDHFVVIGSKIKFTLVPGGATTAPCAFGINVNDDTTVVPSEFTSLSEQTQSNIKYFAPNNTKPLALTKTWSAKKFFGGSILANTELQGSPASGPTEQSYFALYIQSLDGATTAACYAVVEITYIALWKELKDIAAS